MKVRSQRPLISSLWPHRLGFDYFLMNIELLIKEKTLNLRIDFFPSGLKLTIRAWGELAASLARSFHFAVGLPVARNVRVRNGNYVQYSYRQGFLSKGLSMRCSKLSFYIRKWTLFIHFPLDSGRSKRMI